MRLTLVFNGTNDLQRLGYKPLLKFRQNFASRKLHKKIRRIFDSCANPAMIYRSCCKSFLSHASRNLQIRQEEKKRFSYALLAREIQTQKAFFTSCFPNFYSRQEPWRESVRRQLILVFFKGGKGNKDLKENRL